MLNKKCIIPVLGIAIFVLAWSGPASATSFGLFGTSPPAEHVIIQAGPYEFIELGVYIKLDYEEDTLHQFSMVVEWNVDDFCLPYDAELTYITSTEEMWIGGELMTDGIPVEEGNTVTFEGYGHEPESYISGPDEFRVGTIYFIVEQPVEDGLDACLAEGEVQWVDAQWEEINPIIFGDLSVNEAPVASSGKSWGMIKSLYK